MKKSFEAGTKIDYQNSKVFFEQHISIFYTFFGFMVKILNIQKNSKIYAVCMQIYIINKILAFLKTL